MFDSKENFVGNLSVNFKQGNDKGIIIFSRRLSWGHVYWRKKIISSICEIIVLAEKIRTEFVEIKNKTLSASDRRNWMSDENNKCNKDNCLL